MQYGLALLNGGVCGDALMLAELGCLGEKAGWDGVFVEDYIVHQSDGAVPTCDPWIALDGSFFHVLRHDSCYNYRSRVSGTF